MIQNRLILLSSLTLLCSFCLPKTVFSQKEITCDGKYVFAMDRGTLLIKSTSFDWSLEIEDAVNTSFSSDGKQIVFQKRDTLYAIELGTNHKRFISGVQAFEFLIGSHHDWLAYRFNETPEQIVFENLGTKTVKYSEEALEYLFNKTNSTLLLKAVSRDEQRRISTLNLLDLELGERREIWNSYDSSVNCIRQAIDEQGTTVAFIIRTTKYGGSSSSVWVYRKGMEKANILVADTSSGIMNDYSISDKMLRISKGGGNILIRLKNHSSSVKDASDKAQMNEVWSYLDPVIQSQQRLNPKQVEFSTIVSVGEKNITRVQSSRSILISTDNLLTGPQFTDDYALVCEFDGDIIHSDLLADTYVMNEYNWNKATRFNIFLVNTHNGSKQILKKGGKAASSILPRWEFSPEGKFIIYFDWDSKNYFVYEISSGKSKNLTATTNSKWYRGETVVYPRGFYDIPRFVHDESISIACWENDDKSLIVSDQFSDLWLLHPIAQKKPINLTSGFARKNAVKFLIQNSASVYSDGYALLIGTDAKNHKTGLYLCNIDTLQTGLKTLNVSTCIYSNVQAKIVSNKSIFCFSRESSNEKKARYYTGDFKRVYRLESLYAKHNKANPYPPFEVIKWQTFDNKEAIGTLFKPVGFDPKKKYPIIFTYYDHLSPDPVNKYREGSGGNTYTSNGYLNFFVNIRYEIGDVGLSAYNYVVSAAITLSKLAFVDSKKMGITGMSFGGYQTNFIATHTDIFAAAASEAGPANLFAFYGTENIDEEGYGHNAAIEGGQFGIGSNPWERPDLYIKNSPLFYADRINTPILLMANKYDHRTPVSGSIEFFTALRRLGKKAWLILGPLEKHGGPNSPYLMQFFNHYLKGAPAPIWMLNPVPYSEQGDPKLLELDSTGRVPGDGLLMENNGALNPQQKKLLMHKTRFNENGWIEEANAEKKK